MKKIITTGLAALMLLAISCTKETLRTQPAASTQTQDNTTLSTGHYVGERFGGGVIFYLTKDGLHGLIADTTDIGYRAWNGGDTAIETGATKTGVRAGKVNTFKIIKALGSSGFYAALSCARSKRGGYTDWFLPSKDELHALYRQKDAVGGFDPNILYWSSSEYKFNYVWSYAWTQGFWDGGYQGVLEGYEIAGVRAIRAF